MHSLLLQMYSLCVREMREKMGPNEWDEIKKTSILLIWIFRCILLLKMKSGMYFRRTVK
jgi:hypothetical protein